MSIREDAEVCLSTLPPDIIMIIIEMMEPKLIGKLRYISPIWNSTVHDYLSSGTRLTAIDILSFHFNDNDHQKLESIQIRRRLRNGRLSDNVYSDLDKIGTLYIHCSKINVIILNVQHIFPNTLTYLRELVGTIPVDKIKLKTVVFNQHTRDALFALIQSNNGQHLNITVGRCEINMHKFVFESMQLLRSITIHQALPTAPVPAMRSFWNALRQAMNIDEKTTTADARYWSEFARNQNAVKPRAIRAQYQPPNGFYAGSISVWRT